MTLSDPLLSRHRLGELLGADVLGPDGTRLGHVNDVRLAPAAAVRGVFPELVVEGLVVDGKHAGSLLGYDRRREQGPWLLRRLVRALHRGAGYLAWDDVERVDWGSGAVHARTGLQPLS